MSDPLSSAAPAAAEEINSQLSPEAPIEQAPVAQEAAVENIQEKADSGEKLTKKEEKILKEYKLKVNGKDKTVKLDLSNDEEVIRYLQKSEASDSKFKEAAEVRQAALNFIEELKKNPRKVLADPNIGVDLKKFAEEIMNDALLDMEKTPEQRELEAARKELQDIKKKQEEEKNAADQKDRERIQAEHEKNLEADISAALDVGGLPKTARTVKTMADYMIIALQNGIELTAQEIAPIVKSTTLSDFKEVVNSLSDDQLEDFIGKEVIGRIRKRNVAKVKAVETASSIKATGASESKKVEEKKPVVKQTIRDFLKV